MLGEGPLLPKTAVNLVLEERGSHRCSRRVFDNLLSPGSSPATDVTNGDTSHGGGCVAKRTRSHTNRNSDARRHGLGPDTRMGCREDGSRTHCGGERNMRCHRAENSEACKAHGAFPDEKGEVVEPGELLECGCFQEKPSDVHSSGKEITDSDGDTADEFIVFGGQRKGGKKGVHGRSSGRRGLAGKPAVRRELAGAGQPVIDLTEPQEPPSRVQQGAPRGSSHCFIDLTSEDTPLKLAPCPVSLASRRPRATKNVNSAGGAAGHQSNPGDDSAAGIGMAEGTSTAAAGESYSTAIDLLSSPAPVTQGTGSSKSNGAPGASLRSNSGGQSASSAGAPGTAGPMASSAYGTSDDKMQWSPSWRPPSPRICCAVCHGLISNFRDAMGSPCCLANYCLACARQHYRPLLLRLTQRLQEQQQHRERQQQLLGAAGGQEVPALSAGTLPCINCGADLCVFEVQALCPAEFRQYEEAVTACSLAHNRLFTTCPGCSAPVEAVPEEAAPSQVAQRKGMERNAPGPAGAAGGGAQVELDDSGRPLTQQALAHRGRCRFRCAACSAVFCSQCRSVPYHLGRTCEEAAEAASRPSCRFCGEPVEVDAGGQAAEGGSAGRGRRGSAGKGPEATKAAFLRKRLELVELSARDGGRSAGIRAVKGLLAELGADAAWCVEKRELLGVAGVAVRVCGEEECRKKLREVCTRTHPCGHACGGVRGEKECLPCLEPDCHKVAPSTPRGGSSSRVAPAPPPALAPLPSPADFCAICWTEALSAAPALRLQRCGHVVHAACAQEKLRASFPGPPVSLAFLRCPLCPAAMSHPALQPLLDPALKLKEEVEGLALQCMLAEMPASARKARAHRAAASPASGSRGRERSHGKGKGKGRAEQADAGAAAPGAPGEQGDAALVEEGLRKFLFFVCSKCKQPYFGGERRCGERQGEAGQGEEAGHGGDGGAAAQAGGPPNAPAAAAAGRKEELVCGGCAAKDARRAAQQQQQQPQAAGAAGGSGGGSGAAPVCLRGHGERYVQFKCRYCCAVATFFCFGTTHFCTACHRIRPDSSRTAWVAPQCRGGKDCPLAVEWHPRAPAEHCLGCALCRIEEEGRAK